jgi:hypothetical protein
VEQAKQHIASLKRQAEQNQRPGELGELEISVTPVGRFDERSVEAYAAAGVHRLIVLPKLHATHAERHKPAALDELLRNIEAVRKIVGKS